MGWVLGTEDGQHRAGGTVLNVVTMESFHSPCPLAPMGSQLAGGKAGCSSQLVSTHWVFLPLELKKTQAGRLEWVSHFWQNLQDSPQLLPPGAPAIHSLDLCALPCTLSPAQIPCQACPDPRSPHGPAFASFLPHCQAVCALDLCLPPSKKAGAPVPEAGAQGRCV